MKNKSFWAILALLAVIFVAGFTQQQSVKAEGNFRYIIIDSSDDTILLDTQGGTTWHLEHDGEGQRVWTEILKRKPGSGE